MALIPRKASTLPLRKTGKPLPQKGKVLVKKPVSKKPLSSPDKVLPIAKKKKPGKPLPTKREFKSPRPLVKSFGDPPKSAQKNKPGDVWTVPYADRPEHTSFRAITGPDEMVAKTLYMADYGQRRIVGILTGTPDGYTVGWDTCGRCHKHVSWCQCKAMLFPPYILKWKSKSREEIMNHGVPSFLQSDDQKEDGKKKLLPKRSTTKTLPLKKKAK